MAATNPQASMQTLDMSEDTAATEQSPSRWFDKLVRITMVITIISILVGAVVSVGLLIVQTIWPSEYSTACNSTVSRCEMKLDLILVDFAVACFKLSYACICPSVCICIIIPLFAIGSFQSTYEGRATSCLNLEDHLDRVIKILNQKRLVMMKKLGDSSSTEGD